MQDKEGLKEDWIFFLIITLEGNFFFYFENVSRFHLLFGTNFNLLMFY